MSPRSLKAGPGCMGCHPRLRAARMLASTTDGTTGNVDVAARSTGPCWSTCSTARSNRPQAHGVQQRTALVTRQRCTAPSTVIRRAPFCLSATDPPSLARRFRARPQQLASVAPSRPSTRRTPLLHPAATPFHPVATPSIPRAGSFVLLTLKYRVATRTEDQQRPGLWI